MQPYKIDIKFQIELNLPSDNLDIVRKEISKIFPNLPPSYRVGKVAKLPKQILGEFSPDDVFPYIFDTRREYTIAGQSYMVRMNSQRYQLFAATPYCVACGLQGVKFLLELPCDTTIPHFNFYGVENEQLVLMTKDHIKAKAYGGEDVIQNYQTMCAVCNTLKGSSRMTIENVAKLRKLYDKYKLKLTQKALATKLRVAKSKLIIPMSPGERMMYYLKKMRGSGLAKQKAQREQLVCNTEIWVCIRGTKLFAGTEHMAKTWGLEVVDKIAPGSVVIPTGLSCQRHVEVRYKDKVFWIYHGFSQ